MKEEGAIDRIYQKVAENETGDSRDVMALFETRDFEVDVNFCDDMIANGAAKNAKKMADAILADDEMPEDDLLHGFRCLREDGLFSRRLPVHRDAVDRRRRLQHR